MTHLQDALIAVDVLRQPELQEELSGVGGDHEAVAEVGQHAHYRAGIRNICVQKLLSKEMGSELEEGWVSEAQREKFPKSPGPLGHWR